MIYALIIAIDDYPAPVPKLRGCINDAMAIQAYLEGNYACEELSIKTLFDADATKANIIAGFQHFKVAKAEDTCLLYYVGHGSQAICPPEFRHLEVDGKVETIVCYDSRLPGGRDLMDKEQSYLIWEAVHKNEPHFIAIYDACHSGSNTRSEVRARMAATHRDIPQAREFHGHERYSFRLDAGNKQLEPPIGRHVQLAAARANQTAKELQIDGKTRGAFSYHLVALLEQYNGQLTYAELVTQLQGRIGNIVKDQTPQNHAEVPKDKNRYFLGQVPANRPKHYGVHYDQKRKSWVINAGSMHNLPVDQPKEIALRVRTADGEMIPAGVTKVDIMHSHLNGLDHLDKKDTYLAIIDKIPVRKLKIAFAPGSEKRGMALVKQAAADLASPYFELHEKASEADFWVRATDETLRLTLPSDEHPVFRRLEGYTQDMANVFVGDTQDVAYWHYVRTIQNPRTTLSDQDFKIELSKIDQPGEYLKDDLCPATLIEDWRGENIFNYDYDENAPEGQRWLQPAFRLQVTNTSSRPLYVSAVVMLSNYLISNKFLPKIKLPAGESVHLRELVGAATYKTIPLVVYDEFLSHGVNELTEHIKLFVSTQEIDTDSFNQDALEMDTKKPEPRERFGRDNSAYPPQHDWCTRDIALTVVRPTREVLLQAEEARAVGNELTIKLPKGTSAKAMLNSRKATNRSLAVAGQAMPELPSGWMAHDLGQGFSQQAPVNLLELYDFQGAEHITADNPLQVQLNNGVGEDELVVPVAFDEESGLYYPVGLMNEDGSIRIDTLPPESAVGTRSLGGSIKIFFQKTIG
ncbi:MAG: caspase family protein, partial [Bacteroidota bacterium]